MKISDLQNSGIRVGSLVFDEGNRKCMLSTQYSKKKYEYEAYGDDDFQVEYPNKTGIYLSSVINPVPVSKELLFKCGAVRHKSLILDSYTLDIPAHQNELKQLSITIQKGNQYIHLRNGDLSAPREDDSIITIYNSDVRGELFMHTIQNIYFALSGKELQFKL